MVKQTVVHPHSTVLLGIKKEQTIEKQNNLDKSPENYAEWGKKPNSKFYVLRHFIYTSFFK